MRKEMDEDNTNWWYLLLMLTAISNKPLVELSIQQNDSREKITYEYAGNHFMELLLEEEFEKENQE